jgi:riboflavin kinase/FMN adenylyltransferase
MSGNTFRSLEEVNGRFGPCALAIGNFDGVHIGHRKLIAEAVQFASEQGITPAVLTFDPHPTAVVAPDRVPPMICTMEQRLKLLGEAGAQKIFVLTFTAELAQQSPEEFVSGLLVKSLETRGVFVGEGFRFGYKQSGTPEVLSQLASQYNFSARFVHPVSYRGEIVSSSAIRRYIGSGNVSRASRLLGRCYSLEGEVVKGQGIGSKQTVPTLNLRPDCHLVLPRGVYATETLDLESGRKWESVTNSGYRPTFGGTELTVETYLLSPLGDSSPERIQVQFRHFIRPEKQFPDAAGLRAQIFRDVARAQVFTRRWRKFAQSQSSLY